MRIATKPKRLPDNLAAIGIGVLFIVSIFFLAELFANVGIGWDFAAHYLNGLALTNPNFYVSSAMKHGNVISKGIYFEPFRAPLSYFLMAALIIINKGTAEYAYALLTLLFFFIGVFYVSKCMDIDRLMFISLTITPLVLGFMLINGADILTLGLIVFGIGFLLRKSRYFGLFLGLACLAKYTSLIFLPMLFLLEKPKKIVGAFLLFAIVTLPWIAFNAVFFKSPLYSYTTEMNTAFNSVNIGINPIVLVVFAYPVLALILYAWLNRRSSRVYNKLKDGNKWHYLVFSIFLLLAIVSSLLVLPNQPNPANQMRFTFPLSFGAAALVSLYIGKDAPYLKVNRLKIALPLIFLAITAAGFLAAPLYLNYIKAGPPASSEIHSAISNMQKLGITGCAVVSNAWVWLNYYNITSFSPFYYNTAISRYPIIIFNSTGVSSMPAWLSGSALALRRNGTSIYLPNNYVCAD